MNRLKERYQQDVVPAMKKEFGYGNVMAIPRIEKVALVTDIEWLRRAAHWEDRMFRGLQIQAFMLADREEAQIWLQAD